MTLTPPTTPHGDDPLARAGLLAHFVDAVHAAHSHLQRANTDCPEVASAREHLERAIALARGAPESAGAST